LKLFFKSFQTRYLLGSLRLSRLERDGDNIENPKTCKPFFKKFFLFFLSEKKGPERPFSQKYLSVYQ